MFCLFCNCSSLNSLPDITKWNFNKNLKKENIFDGVDPKIIPKQFKSYLDSLIKLFK